MSSHGRILPVFVDGNVYLYMGSYRDDGGLRLRRDYSRLGYVLYVDGAYQIYMLDLDSECFSNDSGIDIRPNFIIPQELGLGVLRFCCVGSSIYVFPVSRSKWCDIVEQKLFKIALSRRFSELEDHVLSEDMNENGMLEKVSSGLSPKYSAIPLRWGLKIVVFSSRIIFEDQLAHMEWGKRGIVDFEIFCPVRNESIPLPPLLVRPGRRFYINFEFFNGHASQWESFLISRKSSSSSDFYFTIDSYGIDRDTLLIQADFGATFCFDLRYGRDAQWQLLTPPLFKSKDQTFLVEDDKNGKMLVDAFSITVGQQDIQYPPLSSPCTYQGYTLLTHPTPVIVRLGLDAPRAEVGYEIVTDKLRWCIDTSIVEDEGECESGSVNLKMVPRSSWKFVLKDQDVMRAQIVDVFFMFY